MRTARARAIDHFASLGIGQRAEDRRPGEDARDRFRVHGADDTVGRSSGTDVLIANWYDSRGDKARSLA